MNTRENEIIQDFKESQCNEIQLNLGKEEFKILINKGLNSENITKVVIDHLNYHGNYEAVIDKSGNITYGSSVFGFDNDINITTTIQETIGTEEGDQCMRIDEEGNTCLGVIEIEDRKSCTCHLGMPPCSACTEGLLYCEECGWEKDNA